MSGGARFLKRVRLAGTAVMAGLDPAIQPQNPKRWNLFFWMAASEGGHDNK